MCNMLLHCHHIDLMKRVWSNSVADLAPSASLSIVSTFRAFLALHTFVLFLARGSQDLEENRGGRVQPAPAETP